MLLDGLNYLLRIQRVPDNEVFQICLDFWHAFAQDLYATETGRSAPRPGGYGNDDTFEPPVTSEGPGGVASRFGGRAPEAGRRPTPASSSSSTAACSLKLDW